MIKHCKFCLKPIAKPIAFISALLLSMGIHAEVVMLDRIVVVVDETAITQTQLDDRVNEIKDRAKSNTMSLPSDSVLREQILDVLINEALQLNMADRFGVKGTDQDIDTAISNILQSQKMSQQALLNEIQKSGKTFKEFRESLRLQITLQQIASGVVNSRIQVTDQDVDSFLKSADAKFWSSPDYNLGHILIPVPKSSTFEQVQAAEAKATALYEQLSSGGDFEAAAIANSKGPAALKGGDLGWRKTTALPTLFADIVPKLEINEVAKPARSMAGFHILKLKGKKGDDKQVITQTKVAHILLKPNELRNDDESKVLLVAMRQDIIDGKTTFAEMAKENTDDIASKQSGGSMGWTNPGMFVPEFDQTMNNATEGEISEPFQTQFGWHILVVEGRRDEDVTEDMRRVRAQNVIRSRRFEDELQLWIQEMRDAAYIDIRV